MIFNLIEHKTLRIKQCVINHGLPAICRSTVVVTKSQRYCLVETKMTFHVFPPFPKTSRKMRILFTKQALTLSNMTQNRLCKSVPHIEVSQALFLLLKGMFAFSCQPSTTRTCLEFYPLNAGHPLSP